MQDEVEGGGGNTPVTPASQTGKVGGKYSILALKP